MAQFKKKEIRDSLLKAARAEFMEHGFVKANMRSIAARAGQNPGNIYNYFENKDALFHGVLEETISTVDKAISFIKSWQPSAGQPIYSMEDERAAVYAVIDYVDRHREDVVLLAFRSQGSSIERLREVLRMEMTEIFSKVIGDVVAFSRDEYSFAPSTFFCGNLVRFFLEGLLDMVQRGMSREEMLSHAEEMLVFYYNGLIRLMSDGV